MAGLGQIAIGGGGSFQAVNPAAISDLDALDPRLNGSQNRTAAPVAAPMAAATTTPVYQPTLGSQTIGGTNDNVPTTRVTIGPNGQLISNGGPTTSAPLAGSQTGAPAAAQPEPVSIAPVRAPEPVDPLTAPGRRTNPIVDWQYGVYNEETIATVLKVNGITMEELKQLNPDMKPGSMMVIPTRDVVATNGGGMAIPDHVREHVAKTGGSLAIAGEGAGGSVLMAPITANAPTVGAQPVVGGGAAAPAAVTPGNLDLTGLTQLFSTLSAYRKNLP